MKPDKTDLPDFRGEVIHWLAERNIAFEELHHPPLPTAEAARAYWEGHEGTFCRNLFFRNHKGNQHYLIILENTVHFDIRGLEKRLGQGKLTLGSDWRLKQYLGVNPGSVSVFSLLFDKERHVKVFLDKGLESATKLGFHPNDNRYTLIINREYVELFLNQQGNEWSYDALGNID